MRVAISCLYYHDFLLILCTESAAVAVSGRLLSNNSLVTLSDIGDCGLRCVTARVDCCSSGVAPDSDEDIAKWINPHIETVGSTGRFSSSLSGEGRQLGFVNLHTIADTLTSSDEGLYRCVLPAPDPAARTELQTYYIWIYRDGHGKMCMMIV